MIGRLASMAMAAGLSLAVLVCMVTGCYDVPKPECGFVCGPGGACPADYICNASDGRCHLVGTPISMVCPTFDGGTDAPDLTPPLLVGQNPPDGATNVDPNISVLAVFSEDVIIGASAFVVTQGMVPVNGFVQFDPSTNTASFTPAMPFTSGSVYEVTIGPDITDFSGNPLDNPSAWSFTIIVDTIQPSVTTLAPPNGASGVPVTTTVTASFSETVVGVTSSSFLVSDSNGPVAGTVTYAMGTLTAAFTPEVQLAPNMLHTVTLTSGITDPAGNTLAGAPLMWTFTTGADTAGPMILLRAPSPNQPQVAITSTINVTFDEQVIGVSGATFTVSPTSGTPIAGAVTYDAGTRTATFTPSAPLANSTQYTVMLGAGITDQFGNMMTGAPIAYFFTTIPEMIPPMVVARVPAVDATGVGVDDPITAMFSESVMNVSASTFTLQQAGTAVAGTVSYDDPSRTATFTPDLQLLANIVYTVTLTPLIEDAFGNPLAGGNAVTWMFTTGVDAAPPQLTATLPASGATGIGVGAMVVVVFDEPVLNVTTTTFTLDNGVTGTIASSMNGRQYTFTPAAALTAATTYTVTLSTAITDVGGTALSAPLTFTFTTAP